MMYLSWLVLSLAGKLILALIPEPSVVPMLVMAYLFPVLYVNVSIFVQEP